MGNVMNFDKQLIHKTFSKIIGTDEEVIVHHIDQFVLNFYKYQYEINITGQMCVFNSLYIYDKLEEYGIEAKVEYGSASMIDGYGRVNIINHTWVTSQWVKVNNQIIEPNVDVLSFHKTLKYIPYHKSLTYIKKNVPKNDRPYYVELINNHKQCMLDLFKDRDDLPSHLISYRKMIHNRNGNIILGNIIKNIMKTQQEKADKIRKFERDMKSMGFTIRRKK